MSKKINVNDLSGILNGVVQTGGKPNAITYDGSTGMQSPKTITKILTRASEKESTTNVYGSKELVVLEAPYMAEDLVNVNRNIKYAQMCLKDSLSRDEAPVMSSLLYSSVLNYRNDAQHDLALLANLSWLNVAHKVIVYIDYGISPRMTASINNAKLKNIRVEYRRLGNVLSKGDK